MEKVGKMKRAELLPLKVYQYSGPSLQRQQLFPNIEAEFAFIKNAYFERESHFAVFKMTL